MSTLYADAHELVARILRRTVRTADGCWIFTGATNSRGYGLVCSGKRSKSVLTHRLVVIARDGSIPQGMTVDHQCHDSQKCLDGDSCAHRRCVNPAHLKVMTRGRNTARRWEHRRTPFVPTQSPVDIPTVLAHGSTVEGRGGRSTSPDRRLVAT